MAADIVEPPAPPPPPAGPGRGLRVALFVSLAVNLLVLGAIGGAALGERRDRGDAHRAEERALIPLGLGLYGRALAPGDRRALADAARDRHADLRPARATVRQGMAELAEAVRAEPFDPARVAAILDSQGRAAARQLEIGRDLLVARLAAMPPEARAAFADRLEDGLRRIPGGPPG
jgi:uncharacterized membrane protein